jgi:hypothetical protein
MRMSRIGKDVKGLIDIKEEVMKLGDEVRGAVK